MQQWWATTTRKLPALSPISSHTASKYRANGKSCFDAATCTRTTTGADGQLTLTVINPSQHCCCCTITAKALCYSFWWRPSRGYFKPGKDIFIFSLSQIHVPSFDLSDSHPAHQIISHPEKQGVSRCSRQAVRQDAELSTKLFLPRSLITYALQPYSGAAARGLMNVTRAPC